MIGSPSNADAVVYLTGNGTAPRRGAGSPHPLLDQSHQAFEPRVMGIPVGTSVDFLNSDRIYHNVFSYSSAKRFDLGKYPRGQKKTVTFDKPGLVKVFCDIHSNMSAFLLVVESRFVAPVRADGAFVFRDLPAGAYGIHAWSPDAGQIERTVAVPDTGTVTVEMGY